MTSTSPDSTSPDSSSPEPTPPNEIERLFEPILQLPIVQRFRLGAIGTRLFVFVLGGALVGIGGMAFLFGEIVKYQAENQIQQTVGSKASALETRVGEAEILAETFRTSILTLHKQKAETPATYQNLALEVFKKRPESVIGLGFGQSENGILPKQQWFFSYYRLDSNDANAKGKLLSLPNGNIRYLEGTKADEFYPETDRYKNYFLPQKDVWSLSLADGDRKQSTYYSQILDDQGKWLGTVFVDLDNVVLDDTLKNPVLNQAGFFALLTEDGQIVAAPNSAAPAEGQKNTYQSIPGLNSVWSKLQNGESGLVEGDNGYWSYARIPGRNWITIAFVPYRAVFSRVALITVVGTLSVGLLLAIVIALTMRYLNHRLRPILNECKRLATTDAETLSLLQHQDEIGQLSIAFFNLMEQIKTNEEHIRQEVVRSLQAEAQLKQAELNEREGQTLRAEVEQLLSVVSAVEQGNLTIEAQGNASITAEVAETLNHLIARLREVMAIVLNAAEQVTHGAGDLKQLAFDVVTHVQQQTQSVDQVKTLVEKTSKLSQDTALQVITVNEAVQLAGSSITQGQQEIATLTKGILVLEQDTNQMLKRTQTLSNYVELATQFAKDQKRIAAMTRILAVNASMLASRASAQQDPEQLAVITREFETIAGQVNTLASQTNQSLVLLQQRTDQIQTVVSGLNHDVQEIGQQVNTFTLGIEQSSKAFDAIRSVNDRVTQIGQHMVQSSQTIAETTQLALASIQDIAAIASITLNQADATQAEAQRMETLSYTLKHNVEFFQLPAQSGEPKDES